MSAGAFFFAGMTRRNQGKRGKLTVVSRAIDVFAIMLLVAAAASFGFGVHALGDRQDFKALYLLIVGALSLRASTEILRPRGGSA